MKIIFKEKKLEKFIQKKVESIKINNLENKLFSEDDLIREVEKEKDKFINKKFGIFSRLIYSFLHFSNLYNVEKLNTQANFYFNKNVIKILNHSKSVKEFNRILENSKNNITYIKDLKFLFNDEVILSFMFDKEKYKKEDIIKIIKHIESGKSKDNYKVNKKEKENAVVFLKKIINCNKDTEDC